MPEHSPNPFTPPRAELAERPELTPGSPIKAVLLGLAVDLGGSIVTALLVGIAYGVSLVNEDMSNEEFTAAISQITPDSGIFIATFAVGMAFSALGGYVCARIAKRSEYRYGAILATLSAAFGILISAGQYSILQHVLFSFATIASVLVGVRIGRGKKPRH